MEGLCQALRDKDRDVREGAAMALGRIGDARAIYSLVLALLDTESTVRNAATNSLQQIDRQWLRNRSRPSGVAGNRDGIESPGILGPAQRHQIAGTN